MIRRLAIAAGVAVVLGGALVPLADATQTRPDPVVPNSSTVVEFTVETDRYRRGDRAAAAALWAACSATIDGRVSVPAPVAAGVWRAHVTPAVGPHGRERLRGCLQDATLDRVTAELVAIRSIGP